MTKKNIFIVDDSALMRRVMSDIIKQTDQYQVLATANDGEAALTRLRQQKDAIDVLLMDMNMPKMNAVDVLKAMRAEKIEIPTFVFSAISGRQSVETLEALSLGAVDFIKKPDNLLANSAEFKERILELMDAVLGVEPEVASTATAAPTPSPSPVLAHHTKKHTGGKGKVVALACSTGGPRALQDVIPLLPKNLDAPVVLVQHMPKGFTESLAARLNDMSKVAVTEAKDGDVLEKGHVYIAKGGMHMRVFSERGRHVIHLDDAPAVGGLRPYGNYMYESLINSDYAEIVCVVLTGMGADGTDGIKALCQKKNCYVISQDKDTSTVYGMPKMVAQAGLSDEVVPLTQVAKAITNYTGVC